MTPSLHVLQALARSKLLTRDAAASTGIGERRSRKVGSGMEFADYREYGPGDETRHLDARLHARTGGFYIRQHDVEMQLPITIVIDGSRSMLSAGPDKFAMALWLAEVLGYVGLRSSDQVRLAFWSGSSLEVSRRMSGANKHRAMREWLGALTTGGLGSFETGFGQLADSLPGQGLVVLLSDFWIHAMQTHLTALAASGSEIWAMQLLSPHEMDPGLLPEGEAMIIDAETGDTLSVAIDRATLAGYQQLFADHQAGLIDALNAVGGRHNLIQTGANLERFVLNDMRAAGMLSA